MQTYNSKPKEIPKRRCLITGDTIEKTALIRFVVSPEDNIVADINQNLPGKGYWVTANRKIILKAINKNIFFKATKRKINVHQSVLDIIETQLKQKLINQISLCRKAGKAIFGFDKIKASIPKNNIGLLIQAIDGSNREKRRMLTKLSPKSLDSCLTGSDLGSAFGREKVIHCAILKSGFIENISFNANRLNNLKKPVPHYNEF